MLNVKEKAAVAVSQDVKQAVSPEMMP